MILISHRGNIDGRNIDLENHPNYIDKAISLGYDVEIDVWFDDGIWWLGHDNQQYEINFDWIDDRSNKLWVHCKNIQALAWFSTNEKDTKGINYFWHEKDTATLTSFGYVWVYVGKQPVKGSIAVLPEIHNDNVESCIGICSDVIENYKKI